MNGKGKHVTDALAAFVDGELDAKSASDVAEHLLVCRRCRETCEAIRFSAQAACLLPTVPVPEDTFANIERALASVDRPATVSSPVMPLMEPAWSTAGVWAAVAVLDLVVFGIVAWMMVSAPPTAFQVTTLEGTPIVGERTMGRADMIAEGEWLETDSASRARIAVADIGQVEIGPGSRIGLVATGPTEHRLSLERGSMRAVVVAPPRLFLVDTPTATAVDYGCVYTLVSDDDRSTLRVSSGRVALERNGRDVMVPEGAMCESRAGAGVGTPVYEDATEALRDAVRRFDFEGGGVAALTTILAEARPRDALTLEALVPRVADSERPRIQTRLDQLVRR